MVHRTPMGFTGSLYPRVLVSSPESPCVNPQLPMGNKDNVRNFIINYKMSS